MRNTRSLSILFFSFSAFASDMVAIQTVNPNIRIDIRYATANNFTHQVVYPSAQCLLHRDVAEKLSAVQKELETQGFGLKVYDCYRPLSVQKKFWALVPDERYVADPAKGSRHNRGAAVDLTMVDLKGNEVVMPTEYDNMTEHAHRDFMDLPPQAIKNRALLERVMVKHGFVPFPTEWWHFDDADWSKYPIMDEPFTAVK